MTRDDPTAWLISLIQRVPVHVVDTEAAQASGNRAAITYSKAMAAWRDEAAVAIAELSRGCPVRHREAADPFARIATASALLRLEAAE